MSKLPAFFVLPVLVLFNACGPGKENRYPGIKPPIARIQPFEIVSKHGHKRIDNYYWMKNREDTAVIRYLNAENKYLDTMLAHTRTLQKKLYNEMKGRVKEKDESVPYHLDNYFYYTRFEEGYEYPIYCRKKGSLESAEEIVDKVLQFRKEILSAAGCPMKAEGGLEHFCASQKAAGSQAK